MLSVKLYLRVKRKTLFYNKFYKFLNEKHLAELLLLNDPNSKVKLFIDKIAGALQDNKIPKSKPTMKPWITPGISRCIKNIHK